MEILSDKKRKELVDLICLDCTGQLDEEAKQQLRRLEEVYGLGSIDRERILQRLQKEDEFDYTLAYEEFRSLLLLRHKKRRILIRRMAVAVAAVAILFLGVGWLWTYHRVDHQISATSKPLIVPGKSKAIITLSDGKEIKPEKQDRKWQEEKGAVLKYDSCLAVYTVKPDQEAVVYNTVTVPAGGEYQLLLADGTRIWMNAVSRLRFPVRFSGKQREVFLEGEAYFEVVKNKQQPFIVHTSRGSIEVLGTGFNVRDYKDENKVVTTLVEGKVVYRPGNDLKYEIHLEPGEQVEDKADEALRACKVNVALYVGWKDGKYIFENTTLEEIMQVLSRWYDIEVFYLRDEIRNLHFTGDLERYNSINDFLEFMELGGDVHFAIHGRTVVVN